MRTVFFTLLILPAMVLAAFAGTFESLTPGQSTRGDVYRTLGQPTKTEDSGLQCWFDAAPFQGKSIMVTFHPSGIMERLQLEPAQAYSSNDYASWFGLKKPSRVFVENGFRYSLYEAQGVALAQKPPGAAAPVVFFVHYWTAQNGEKDRLLALYSQFKDAHARKDCAAMRAAWQAGQKEFPMVAQFQLDQIREAATCRQLTPSDTETLLLAADTAVFLNPDDESYRTLGYIYSSIADNPAKALNAFSQVDLGNNPDINVFLGACHQKLGHAQKARSHFEAYLATYPNGEYADMARTGLEQVR